jgi:hypothetical protein
MSAVRMEHLAKSARTWMGGALLGALVTVSWAAPVAAQEPPPLPGSPVPTDGWRARIVREGTVSVGGQAQYGSFFAQTGFGGDYDAGPGMNIQLRYRTSRETALGISFGTQRFDAAEDPVDDYDPKYLQAIVTTLDYYQYFKVKSRTPRYLAAGGGLVQTRRRLKDDETDFPGDAGAVTLGGGTEIWWKRWFTIDVSARYYLFVRSQDGAVDLSHNVQLAAGLQFYTSK